MKLCNIQPKHRLGVVPIMLIYHFAPAAVLVEDIDPVPQPPVQTH